MDRKLHFSGMPRSGSQWMHKILWGLKEKADLPVCVQHNHREYSAFKISYRAPLIGIYRDIRDVIVSAYYLNEKRKEHGKEAHPWINRLTEGLPIDEGIHAMCVDPDHQVPRRYRDWYLSFTGKPYVCLLRFEQVTQQPSAIFDALASLGFEVPRSTYNEVWGAFAYKRMRKAHPEHYRTGGQSTWRKVLKPETVNLIERECRAFFELADYPLSVEVQ